MNFFNLDFYGNTILNWSISFGIVIAVLIFSKMLFYFFDKIIKKLTRTTTTQLDDLLVELLKKPTVRLFIVCGIWFAINMLSLSPDIKYFINSIYWIVLLITVIWFVSKLVEALFGREYIILHGKNNDIEDLSLEELGKKGLLVDYLDQYGKVKFGMLKQFYNDAIGYKKKREYKKGFAKFLIRAIPIAIAPIFFPIWLLAQILGTTRAINKILIPTLKMNNFDSFLKNLIVRTMNFAEGDIKPLLGRDYFYDVFHVNDGLINMVKQEHVYEFAAYISKEIQNKNDDQIVPNFWLDDEFRKWLNSKFNLDLPVGDDMIKNKTNSINKT
jgi:hypothetical protein